MVNPPSPPFIRARHFSNGNNKPIKRIVVHCTVSACAVGARNIANFFAGGSVVSSAHYVHDQDEEFQCVGDSSVAYHAPPNTGSIGDELCCSLANKGKGHWTRADHVKMLHRSARDAARLALAYGVPIRKIGPVKMRLGVKGFCGHIDVSRAWGQTNHWDPGPFFPWKWYIRQVRKYAAQLKEPTLPPVAEEVPTFTLQERAKGAGHNVFDRVRAILQLKANTVGSQKRRRRIREVLNGIPKR